METMKLLAHIGTDGILPGWWYKQSGYSNYYCSSF